MFDVVVQLRLLASGQPYLDATCPLYVQNRSRIQGSIHIKVATPSSSRVCLKSIEAHLQMHLIMMRAMALIYLADGRCKVRSPLPRYYTLTLFKVTTVYPIYKGSRFEIQLIHTRRYRAWRRGRRRMLVRLIQLLSRSLGFFLLPYRIHIYIESWTNDTISCR